MVHLRFNKAAAALLVAVYFCALGSEAQAEESAECQRALRMADFAADQYDRRVFQDGGCIPTLNKEFKECGGDACCEAKANLKAAKCVASAESQQISWLDTAASAASEHCSSETAAALQSQLDAARAAYEDGIQFVADMEKAVKRACSGKNHSSQ